MLYYFYESSFMKYLKLALAKFGREEDSIKRKICLGKII